MTKSIWMLNHYAGTPDLPGGTRHFDLAYELTRMGYEVTIFVSAFNHNLQRKVRLLGDESWALEEVDGVKFVWLPSFAYTTNDWRRLVNMLDYTWRAYWLGRRLPAQGSGLAQPDIVMGCSVHLFAVLAGYHLSRHYGARFIMEVRDLWPQTFLDMGVWREGQPHVRFLRWLEQFLYARADRIVALSPLTRDYLARYSESWAAKTVYIPNGTRVSRFEQPDPSGQRTSEPLHAMFLGSIGYKNGVDLVVRAMQMIEQTEPGLVRCTLVGDGPEKPALQQMVRDHGLQSVQFRDPVARTLVPRELSQADVLVLVERKVLYGSSNKLFDYMAAAKPIVSSVFAEHNDLVREVGCGVSGPPDNAEELARNLLAVARMPVEERRAMGERGRAYVREQYDYAVLAHRLSSTFEELDNHAR